MTHQTQSILKHDLPAGRQAQNNAKKNRSHDYTAAIIKTILYADIFNFPLTPHELEWFAISSFPLSKHDIASFSSPHVIKKNGYFCLKGREKIIAKRLENKEINSEKLFLAQKYARVLMNIPTIYCIGISGTLATGNGTKDDDIDFFIITKKNTVWITRLLCLLLAALLGRRRKRGVKKAPNTLCMNMFLDETQLAFPKKKNDIYTAHEIVQFVPLFERNNTYEKFFTANNWVKNVLRNSKQVLEKKNQSVQTRKTHVFLEKIVGFFEKTSYVLQKRILSSHQTHEKVKKNLIAFHPFDYRKFVLNSYNKRLKKYKI